jgi:hypothetical protein
MRAFTALFTASTDRAAGPSRAAAPARYFGVTMRIA